MPLIHDDDTVRVDLSSGHFAEIRPCRLGELEKIQTIDDDVLVPTALLADVVRRWSYEEPVSEEAIVARGLVEQLTDAWLYVSGPDKTRADFAETVRAGTASLRLLLWRLVKESEKL